MYGQGNPPIEFTNNGAIMRSTDYLAPVDVTATTTTGDVLYSIEVNPTIFSNTRVAIMASLFQKCFIRS